MTCPLGRPLASSRPPEKPSTGPASGQLRTRKDFASARPLSSPSTRPSVPHRVSARQLDAIAVDLTDYDKAVLLFLGQVRLATGHQLARRLWSSKAPKDVKARAARRCLARLEEWRVVDRLRQRVGGVRGGSAGVIYSVGPAGRRLLAREGAHLLRLGTPGDRHVAHTLAITELVVRLHEADLGGRLDLVQLETEPACWREFLGGLLATRLVLKPDLFVRIGAGAFEDRYFIELDLGTEHIATLVGKGKRYIEYYRSGEEQSRHDVFPRVLWTVPDRRRGDDVTEALRRLPTGTGRLFVIWPFEEVIGRLEARGGGCVMTPRNAVLEGDALDLLGTLAPASVEAVVTSPPYFRARHYEAGPAELGQEAPGSRTCGRSVERSREYWCRPAATG